MPLWGNKDQANNSPIYAPAQFNQTPNTANRDALFGNTTANAVGSGEYVSVVGVSASEIQFTGANGTVYAVNVTNPGTGFTAVATVAFAGGGVANAAPTLNAAATATMKVLSATVGHGGNNYAPGDILSPANGATATVNATINVTSTEIRAATVNAAGSGYSNGNVILIATGTGTQANATVTTNGTGNVTSVSLVNNGVYTVNPTLSGVATSNVTGNGTGLTLNLVTKIFTVAVVNGGSYSVLPNPLTNHPVTNVTGTGVSANLTLTIGLDAISVTNVGAGYVTAPTVTVTGAGASGQTAVAVIVNSTSVAAGRSVGHSGWAIRKVGTGGRAGRVTYEVLVAGGITTDASDDSVLPE